MPDCLYDVICGLGFFTYATSDAEIDDENDGDYDGDKDENKDEVTGSISQGSVSHSLHAACQRWSNGRWTCLQASPAISQSSCHKLWLV